MRIPDPNHSWKTNLSIEFYSNVLHLIHLLKDFVFRQYYSSISSYPLSVTNIPLILSKESVQMYRVILMVWNDQGCHALWSIYYLPIQLSLHITPRIILHNIYCFSIFLITDLEIWNVCRMGSREIVRWSSLEAASSDCISPMHNTREWTLPGMMEFNYPGLVEHRLHHYTITPTSNIIPTEIITPTYIHYV